MYLPPTCGMRGVLLPTPFFHYHGIGAFYLLRLRTFISYLSPRVLSRIYILPPPTSYQCFFFLPASSSTSPSLCLSVSSSLSYSCVLGPLLLLYLFSCPCLSAFSFLLTSFPMIQLSRVGFWVFAISCAYFLSLPTLCSSGSVPVRLTFLLRLMSRLTQASSYRSFQFFAFIVYLIFLPFHLFLPYSSSTSSISFPHFSSSLP